MLKYTHVPVLTNLNVPADTYYDATVLIISQNGGFILYMIDYSSVQTRRHSLHIVGIFSKAASTFNHHIIAY